MMSHVPSTIAASATELATVRVAAAPIAAAPPPPALPATRSFAAIRPGTSLWHLDAGGAGEPVMLLHPGVGDLRLWAYQAAALAAAGYRVVAYDRPGHGRSPAPVGASPSAPDEDLAALADLLALDRFHLVGTAQGARIASDFARRWPHRLRSLTLASATVFTAAARSALGQDDDLLLPPGFTALPPWFRELGPAYRLMDPAGVARWIEIAGDGSGHAAGRPPKPAAGPPVPQAARPAVRTLALTGDADPFAPPPACLAYGVAHPGCTVAVIPDCGHSPFWERPDVFSTVLLGFLAADGA